MWPLRSLSAPKNIFCLLIGGLYWGFTQVCVDLREIVFVCTFFILSQSFSNYGQKTGKNESTFDIGNNLVLY